MIVIPISAVLQSMMGYPSTVKSWSTFKVYTSHNAILLRCLSVMERFRATYS